MRVDLFFAARVEMCVCLLEIVSNNMVKKQVEKTDGLNDALVD